MVALFMTLALLAWGTDSPAQDRLEIYLPPPATAAAIETQLNGDPALAGFSAHVHQRVDDASIAIAEGAEAALVTAFLAEAHPNLTTYLHGLGTDGPTIRYRIVRLARLHETAMTALGMVAEADQRTSQAVIGRIAPAVAGLSLRRFATLENLINALAMEVIDAALLTPNQAHWLAERYRTPLVQVGESLPVPLPCIIGLREATPELRQHLLGLARMRTSSLGGLGLTGFRPAGGTP